MLIHPSGTFKIIWEIFSTAAIMYSVVVIPYRISFYFNAPYSTLFFVTDMTISVFFFIDIILAFNTPFTDTLTDNLVTNRWKIAKQYMAFWFWIDILAAIPFDLIASLITDDASRNIAIVRLIRVLRLVRFVKILEVARGALSKRWKETVDLFNLDKSIVGTLSLILRIFFVAHIVTCFWFLIAASDDPIILKSGEVPVRSNTWVASGLRDQNFESNQSSLYIAGLYWSFMTLLTVGYGDIHPINTQERLYASATMIVGSLMFGAIIAKVREVVEGRNLLAKECRRKEEEFKAFLDEKKVSKALRLKAKVSCIQFMLKLRSTVDYLFIIQMLYVSYYLIINRSESMTICYPSK